MWLLIPSSSSVLLISLLSISVVQGQNQVSPIAGSTQTFLFPPAGVTATNPDPHFPDGTQVGFAGATPSAFSLRLRLLC
jgi:hypothetical protein